MLNDIGSSYFNCAVIFFLKLYFVCRFKRRGVVSLNAACAHSNLNCLYEMCHGEKKWFVFVARPPCHFLDLL